MKVNYLTLLAAATLVLLSVAAARADESAVSALTAEANAAPTTISTTASTAPLAPLAPLAPVATAAGDTATYYQDSDPVQDFIARAGAWAVHQSGSQTKVGEYQNAVQSSPFFDLEGIKSDGCRTVDLSLEGSDNDTDRRQAALLRPASRSQPGLRSLRPPVGREVLCGLDEHTPRLEGPRLHGGHVQP